MNYKFVDSSLELDTADWRGEVVNADGFIVVEVWNNGDEGGNYYVWHDADARWEIEEHAVRNYDNLPMDSWIEDLRGKED